MDKYSKLGTKNFLKRVREVQAKEIVKKGIIINNDQAICKLLGANAGLISRLKAGLQYATIEQMATFCVLFGYNLHEMVINSKPEMNNADILEDISRKLDLINDKIK